MKWFKRRKSCDPAAEYIEKLNREAKLRELAPPTAPSFFNVGSGAYITTDKIQTGSIRTNHIRYDTIKY